MGSAVWRNLKDKFSGVTTHAKIVAFNALTGIIYGNPNQYITDARRLISQFRAAGLKMESECITLFLLQKLPHRHYHSLIRIISQLDQISDEEETLRRIEKDYVQFRE